MRDRSLQVFQAVAKAKSFTRAGEMLHMSQPAVSAQVMQLEHQFSTRLFDRAHNRVHLTEVGERIYPYATAILDYYAELDEAVRELSTEAESELVIGASTTVAEYILPDRLASFCSKHPKILVRMSVGNTEAMVAKLLENRIDIGVVEGAVTNKTLTAVAFDRDELVAIMAPDHPLARASTVSAIDLARYPLVSRETGSGTREMVHEYLCKHGVDTGKLNVAMTLGSLEAIKRAVSRGVGIAVLSAAAVRKERALGDLIVSKLRSPLVRSIYLVHQNCQAKSASVDRLIRFLTAADNAMSSTVSSPAEQ